MITNKKILLSRASLFKNTRSFFNQKKFLEIDTPILSTSLPHEANLYPFLVKSSQSSNNLYLPASPEKALKQVFSWYQKPIFSISKSFRDLESTGPLHLSEFTLLEWYTPHTNYLDTLKLTQEYLDFVFSKFSFSHNTSWETLPLPKLFSRYAPHLKIPNNEPDFNQIFLNQIEPHLSKHPFLFITHYPAFLSPLAQKEENNQFAQRFECYIKGVEIANACTENTDYKSIKQSFLQESKFRTIKKLPNPPLDQDFLDSISLLPPSSGCGLGLDRLLMLLLKLNNLNQITPLNLTQPKK